MKTEEQIKQKIEQLFQKRVEQRLEKYLSKNHRNCLYNLSRTMDGKEHFFCTNVYNPNVKENIIYLCENNEVCKQCKYYVCKHTPESVRSQLMEDISSPSVCGIKEPKLAVLLWVLKEETETMSDDKDGSFFSFLKKLFRRG